MENDGKLICFTSNFFQKSVIYEIETELINYINRIKTSLNFDISLMNAKKNQKFVDYYQREFYTPFIESIMDYVNQEVEKISKKYVDLPNFKRSVEWKLNPNILPTE